MMNQSRREFLLSAVGCALLTAAPRVAGAQGISNYASSSGERELIFECNYFSVYQQGDRCLFVEESGETTVLKYRADKSYVEITWPDGGISIMTQDQNGLVYFDGVVNGEVLYARQPGDPVTYGCVLMSTRKMTVEQAAGPSQIAFEIIGRIPGLSDSLLLGIAGDIFNHLVDQHKDLYVKIEHWYCDSPKMVTRKKIWLYKDSKYTQLLDSWVVEAPVGVEV